MINRLTASIGWMSGKRMYMYKQIIIARKDLNMSSGKLAAQVSHGSMAFLNWFIRNNTDLDGHVDGYIDEDILHNWIEGEFTKCVLQPRIRISC